MARKTQAKPQAAGRPAASSSSPAGTLTLAEALETAALREGGGLTAVFYLLPSPESEVSGALDPRLRDGRLWDPAALATYLEENHPALAAADCGAAAWAEAPGRRLTLNRPHTHAGELNARYAHKPEGWALRFVRGGRPGEAAGWAAAGRTVEETEGAGGPAGAPPARRRAAPPPPAPAASGAGADAASGLWS